VNTDRTTTRDRRSKMTRLIGALVGLLALAAAMPTCAAAQVDLTPVEFGTDAWTTLGGSALEHDGRQSFVGFAYLDGVDLESGVVEVDLFATGATSYPGIAFHLADGRKYEWIYVRPHRAGLYPDAVQYSPTVNAISSWQFWNGDGYTAPVELPENEWVTLRLEFVADQARLYVGDSDEPALYVKDCKLGSDGGSIGVRSPADGSAYFSNFRYGKGDGLEFEPVPPEETPPGTIVDWEISPAFRMDQVDLELPPSEQDVGEFAWQAVACDASGLLDIGRYRSRTGGMPDCVFAKTTLDAAEAETVRLELGYSDAVSVFLNGRVLFTASNAYRQRDPTSLGIIGFHDAVYLPLEAGENELAFIVTESFGGWGLMARDGNASFMVEGVEEAFETDGFLTPECVVHDPERDVLYVSNYDAYRRAGAAQYLSKLKSDGTVEELKWVEGLAMPTGMALAGSTLYAVERSSLVEIDVESGEVVARHAFEGTAFPNDVAVAADGTIYVSDSAGSSVLKYTDGEFSVWLGPDKVSGPNSLCAREGALLIGNGGDHSLRSADTETGEVTTLARLRDGNIDGIAVTPGGDLLVSLWEGKLYRVSGDGSYKKMLDTTVLGSKVADFGYDAESGMLFAPTFYTDQVVGYRVGR
jgi:hypothetical protein